MPSYKIGTLTVNTKNTIGNSPAKLWSNTTVTSDATHTGSGAASVLDDPRVDRIWIEAARSLGFSVERTSDAYASTDGSGRILIGAHDTLDSDDSVAQLVFHELCHALVQGESSLRAPDWGLDNTDERDRVAEDACLRLQAHLADAHALRPHMTPTTVSRAYYVALSAFPLVGDDPACVFARAGARWAASSGWQRAIDGALLSTAALLRTDERWAMANVHPLGLPAGASARQCDSCAWRYEDRDGFSRCRQAAAPGETGPRVDPTYPACALWEPALDCLACGACCREGFDVVGLSVRDPVVDAHPELVIRRGARFVLRRQGAFCAALEKNETYRCRIYEQRPQACRELAAGGARCLEARRRVGLSG